MYVLLSEFRLTYISELISNSEVRRRWNGVGPIVDFLSFFLSFSSTSICTSSSCSMYSMLPLSFYQRESAQISLSAWARRRDSQPGASQTPKRQYSLCVSTLDIENLI